MSKLKKMQQIANKIVKNEKKELENHRAKQFADYVESKMIRGHSKEVAEEMAKKIVYTQ
tara:strand:+ start:192 stop:368 length:177 start_codon:yes stop_codon:yes gene_type:complete